MSPNHFQHLLELVRPLITKKKDTKNAKGNHGRRNVGSNITLFGKGRFPAVSELLISNGKDNSQQYRNKAMLSIKF